MLGSIKWVIDALRNPATCEEIDEAGPYGLYQHVSTLSTLNATNDMPNMHMSENAQMWRPPYYTKYETAMNSLRNTIAEYCSDIEKATRDNLPMRGIATSDFIQTYLANTIDITPRWVLLVSPNNADVKLFVVCQISAFCPIGIIFVLTDLNTTFIRQFNSMHNVSINDAAIIMSAEKWRNVITSDTTLSTHDNTHSIRHYFFVPLAYFCDMTRTSNSYDITRLAI